MNAVHVPVPEISFAWTDIVRWAIDALLVGFIAYKVISFLRGTRAVQLLKGVLVLGFLYLVASLLKLHMMTFLLGKLGLMAVIAVPVIFAPELRSMLERLGREQPFRRLVHGHGHMRIVISEIVAAAGNLSERKVGALIVIERQTGLKEYIETGVRLDSIVSRFLLIQTFEPNTPLHDGAVIIRGDRVAAACCYLPLSSNKHLSKELGTRHRAAVGITEVSDALAVVISEETGTISVAEDGKIVRYLNAKGLEEFLETRLAQDSGFLWLKERETARQNARQDREVAG
ncbi:diadenylate cyclase CdaA [Desulforudis sp. 1088]